MINGRKSAENREVLLCKQLEYSSIIANKSNRLTQSKYQRRIKVADVIGNVAGALWKYLDKNGASSATKIAKETKLDAKDVQRAIGWLAKEGKLSITAKGRTETIALK